MATATTGPRLSGRRAGWIVYKKRQSNNTTRDRGQRASRAVDMGEGSSGRSEWGGGGGGTRGGRNAGARARDDSGSVRRYRPVSPSSLPDLQLLQSGLVQPGLVQRHSYSRTRMAGLVQPDSSRLAMGQEALVRLGSRAPGGRIASGYRWLQARLWTGQNSKRQKSI
jgi:hypothetical protein